MKTLRSALILVFLVISSIVYAGSESSNVAKVKPRYFCDKLYISSESEINADLQLFVFTTDGDVETKAEFNLSEGEFVLNAEKFKKGTYNYFVKDNDLLLAKGSFIKD